MNALKQEGLGLLDYLVIKTGCMYLSDLSQKEMLCEIQHAVRKLDPDNPRDFYMPFYHSSPQSSFCPHLLQYRLDLYNPSAPQIGQSPFVV